MLKLTLTNTHKVLLAVCASMAGVCAYLLWTYRDREEDDEEALKKVITSRMTVISIEVPKHIAGQVIGQNGCNIKRVEEASGARLRFKNDHVGPSGERLVVIRGTQQEAQHAEMMVRQVLRDTPDPVTIQMEVPSWAIGRIIGKGGDNIRNIMKNSKARVDVDRKSIDSKDGLKNITIKGLPNDVDIAKMMIESHVEEETLFKQRRDKQRNLEQAQGMCPRVEGSSPPAEGSPPPVEGSSPPAEGSPPPVEVEGSSPPAEGSSPPAEGSSPPAEGSSPPVQGSYLQVEGSPSPSEGSSLQVEGLSSQVQGPSQDTSRQVLGTLPSAQVEGSSQSAEGMSQQVRDTFPAAEGVAQQAERSPLHQFAERADQPHGRQQTNSKKAGESLFAVFVSAVEHPGHFWVQLIEDALSKELEKTNMEISKYAATHPQLTEPPAVSAYVLAPLINETGVFRAKVQSVDGDVVDIYFLDYGDSELMNWRTLWPMPEEFTTLLPQAFECCLAGVAPSPKGEGEGGEWSEEAITFFEKASYTAKWKMLMAGFLGFSDSEGGLPVLELLDVNKISKELAEEKDKPQHEIIKANIKKISVGQELISRGFAVASDMHVAGQQVVAS